MATLFSNDPPRPIAMRATYRFAQFLMRIVLLVYYRIRVHELQNVPKSGGAMILSNHQSNLDPIVLGCFYPNRVSFLSKKTLLDHPPLSWLLTLLDCIPIDRTSTGIGGMKETLRRLKRGERVVLFPEGQRTFDGQMVPLMPGFCALWKRTRVPVVPIGLDGVFQAWPRGTIIPKPGHIEVVIGQMIPFSLVQHLSDEEMTRFVEEKIKTCFLEARKLRNRT